MYPSIPPSVTVQRTDDHLPTTPPTRIATICSTTMVSPSLCFSLIPHGTTPSILPCPLTCPPTTDYRSSASGCILYAVPDVSLTLIIAFFVQGSPPQANPSLPRRPSAPSKTPRQLPGRKRHRLRKASATAARNGLLLRVLRKSRSKYRKYIGALRPFRATEERPLMCGAAARWKHAASCHQGSTLDGECDVFVEDSVFEQIRAETTQSEHAGPPEA